MLALDDETHRLEMLKSYNVMDTAAEPASDDIVNLASLMCATPIALVALITENHQCFKARAGLNMPQTRRDQAFSAQAIRNPSTLMEVQDASKAPRFMGNPMVVVEPGIRFYAGAPFLTPSDAVLGAVCVIDRMPRQLRHAMAQGLQALARQAGELLALRGAHSDLETLNQSVMDMQAELEQYQVQLESQNADLAQANPVDAATGLNNQRTSERVLAEELYRVERNQSRMALLLADIDHFKVFARDFGVVAANDALLRQAGVPLQSHRFAVLLSRAPTAPSLWQSPSVFAARWRLCRRLGVGCGLWVSIGVAIARTVDAPMDIMVLATSALTHATELGGNQVAIAAGGKTD